MHIEHIALWTKNLEKMKDFYCTYFQAVAGEKHTNPAKQFESYFLAFSGGARLELMRIPAVPVSQNSPELQATGYIHIAVSTGSEKAVNECTENLRRDGYEILSEPRRTGDGYYESCIRDPDGNRIEITI